MASIYLFFQLQGEVNYFSWFGSQKRINKGECFSPLITLSKYPNNINRMFVDGLIIFFRSLVFLGSLYNVMF